MTDRTEEEEAQVEQCTLARMMVSRRERCRRQRVLEQYMHCYVSIHIHMRLFGFSDVVAEYLRTRLYCLPSPQLIVRGQVAELNATARAPRNANVANKLQRAAILAISICATPSCP
jgi:hypothetical protein